MSDRPLPAASPESDDRPALERLLDIMVRLRDPVRGCPWDREQTFATIAPYTIEEAYEVADAIEREDLSALKEELGDLLFQVVFHARMAEERQLFDFDAVAETLVEKMIRRHPHVFGDQVIDTPQDQTVAWETHKAAERARKNAGALDGVSVNLPALLRAEKIQKRASRVGFDWREPGPALAKVTEEVAELAHELDTGAPVERVADEIGDLLFACVNVSRLAGVDPETALRRATHKFERRFRGVEAQLARLGRQPSESTLEEMDALWKAVKAEE